MSRFIRGLTACNNETSWWHECAATAPVAPHNRRTAEKSLHRHGWLSMDKLRSIFYELAMDILCNTGEYKILG
jgi:hypothetical protein